MGRYDDDIDYREMDWSETTYAEGWWTVWDKEDNIDYLIRVKIRYTVTPIDFFESDVDYDLEIQKAFYCDEEDNIHMLTRNQIPKRVIDRMHEVLSKEGLPFLDTDAVIEKIYGVK